MSSPHWPLLSITKPHSHAPLRNIHVPVQHAYVSNDDWSPQSRCCLYPILGHTDLLSNGLITFIIQTHSDLLSFLEMLAACLYLPCLPQTCLRFPRLVPASLQLSLPCHVFRMVFTGVSVIAGVPLLSPELLLLQRSLSSEFFRDPLQGFLLSS